MIKLSNSYMISVVTKLLVLLVVAKSVSLALWWFLPSDGVELQVQGNYKSKYQRVDFANMIDGIVVEKATTVAANQVSVSNGISIENMILKGLYGSGTKGFAIVVLKSSPKNTSIISVGEEFSGYVLKTILREGVVFTKAGKDYVLFMDNVKEGEAAQINTPVYTPANPEDKKTVSKTDIEFYAKNPNEIWKDISIDEVKVGNEIKGFKVNKINKASKMYQLGIKEGDLIIEVNNVRLKSYKDAIDVYKDINNLSSVQIIVLRDNKEVELVYEIN